jgi:adenylate cyclase
VAGTRRLTTIMFTDMVGFTASAQTNEAGALRLLREQEELVRPVLAAHRGREIKSTGDGFLIEFNSALEATECATAIQRRIQERNSQSAIAPILLRVGVHLGDVEQRGEDIFGDAVNVASRIGPCAAPGGICISGPVFDQVRNKLPNALVKLAPRELKNVQIAVDVYKVLLPWMEATPMSRGSESRFDHRLAVLPFANMSPDPQDEFFADGLTEEFIAELSRVPGLQVIARTSVMRYKAAPKGIREIGSELNVDVALEGSVRKAGSRIRITAQLIDTASEGHLWADRFDRELTDIFAVQTEIAQNVAAKLDVRLRGTGPALRQPTRDLDAYFLYLKGRALWNRRTLSSVRQALTSFEAAVARDPSFAEAYSGLADCHLILTSNLEEMAWAEAGPKAKAAATRAIGLNDRLAEPHASLGLALSHEYAWSESEREFRRAIELNPSYAPAHLWYHLLLASTGRPEAARAELARAEEADPLSPVVLLNAGRWEALFGRDEAALRYWDHSTEAEPEFAEFVQLFRLLFFASRGRKEEALTCFRAIEPSWGNASERLEEDYTWVPATLYGVLGLKEEARRSLDRLLKISQTTYVPAAGIARAYAALGDSDKFFHWILRGTEDHSTDLFELRISPLFETLRADPRFREIYRRCGLPDQSLAPGGSNSSP